MMAYKVLTTLVGFLCHNFAAFGYLLFKKQYLTISQAVLDSFHVNFIPNCWKSSPNTYGFCLQRGMGYGLLRLYGLWSTFPCEPSRWTQKRMEFKGVWGMWAMGYEGVDCSKGWDAVGTGERGRDTYTFNSPSRQLRCPTALCDPHQVSG